MSVKCGRLEGLTISSQPVNRFSGKYRIVDISQPYTSPSYYKNSFTVICLLLFVMNYFRVAEMYPKEMNSRAVAINMSEKKQSSEKNSKETYKFRKNTKLLQGIG